MSLKFLVQGQKLTLVNPIVVSGTHEYITCAAEFFGDEWDGMLKFAKFTLGTNTYVQSFANNKISKEAHLDLTKGYWNVMAYGIKVDPTVADNYDPSHTYNIGDYCLHGGWTYKCTAQTTGTWDDNDWDMDSSIITERVTTNSHVLEVQSEGEGVPPFSPSTEDQVLSNAAHAYNNTITQADGTVDNNVGIPSVAVSVSGSDGAKKLTFTFTNMKGNGISSIAKTGTSGLTDTYTITYDNGTVTTFTVANGKGISSIVENDDRTMTITYNDGTTQTVNGIKDVYDDMSEFLEDAEAAETARQSAETHRINAETSRVSAETARASAETSRVNAETGRSTAETGRSTAETGRVNAETGRVTAETGRVNAETAREAAKIVAGTATIDNNSGTPEVTVSLTDHTGGGKDINFAFRNLKGSGGVVDSVNGISQQNVVVDSGDIKVDKTAQTPVTVKEKLTEQSGQIVALQDSLTNKGADSGDVGKYAKVKTVANNKVSGWELTGWGGINSDIPAYDFPTETTEEIQFQAKQVGYGQSTVQAALDTMTPSLAAKCDKTAVPSELMTQSETLTGIQQFPYFVETAPQSASDTGAKGQMYIGADYVYICVATNTWKRFAITTF